MRYYFIPIRMGIIKRTTPNVGENVEKLEPLCVSGGNEKWQSFCGKQYGDFFEKLSIELSYDPAIPLLGVCPKEVKAGTEQIFEHPCSQ